MATVKYLSSTWIGVLLLLSIFEDGESMGPKKCDCGETSFSDDSGTITSPYYPRNYRNNCQCTYTITVTSPNRIRLQFHSIDFGDSGCLQDYVQVYDGQSTSAAIITWFCSNRVNIRNPVTSQTQKLIIKFTSNRSRVGRGFRSTYTIVSPTTDAPTTHTTTPPTTTTHSTTRIKTPLITSPEKSTTVSTSTLAATTTKVVTFTILSSEEPLDIFPEFTTPLITQRTSEKARTILADVSTTASPNPSTDMLDAQGQSSLPTYVWILPIIIVIVLIVLAVFLLCYVKNKRTVKTSKVNGSRETPDAVQPDVLAADGTTVIFNQTYQSNDDFIPNIVYQPVEDDIVNATTVKTESNNTAVVDSRSDRYFEASPLYQTAGIPVTKPESTTHNYDRLVDDKTPSDQQNPGESVYQYADIDKSEYRYADSTPHYDYAERATLPISHKHTEKPKTHATYEALNPLNKETDTGIPRNNVTGNVSHATPDSIQSPQYMGLENVDKTPYQELLMTEEGEFVDNSIYSGTGTDDGYLYPNVSEVVGKGLSQDSGYDLVDDGAYSAVDERSKDDGNLNSIERSGIYPNNEAYDVVNVNPEGSSTGGQGSRESQTESDVMNGETYETLNYRNPSEVNLSYNETGYLDYKGDGSTAYQPLKPNMNSLFG